MELEGEDGSKFALQCGDKTLFGRGSGFNTDDRTVSRRHVSFQLNDSVSEPPTRVSFQVIGTNPIWVWNSNEGTIKLFNKFDKGHLELGDRFCLSGNKPLWFNLNKVQVSEPESSESQINLEQLDVSQFDPVKEFGFLVMRHEFDQYPKGMIRNVENWEWFLEEPSKESEDDDDFEKTRKNRGKRKVFKDNEDDDWTGDSEDDKDLVAKTGKGKKLGYSTRSRANREPSRDVKVGRNSKRKKTSSVDDTVEEEEEEEDDDETLGGFIVTDEDEEEEQNNDDDEEEEEEEFEEEDDEDVVAG